MCTSDLPLALLAILFPPIAVWIKCGICTADSLINIALCCLGFVPGLIHAWYIIAKHPESDYEPVAGGDDGGENGRIIYHYVSGPQQGPQGPGQQGQAAGGPGSNSQQQQRGYGTVQGGRAEERAEGRVDGGGSKTSGVPPSYEQAVKGDNKVQT